MDYDNSAIGPFCVKFRGEEMNDFFTALTYVNKKIYESNHLTVKSVQEEKQNSKYGAGTFQLSSKTIRFRVSNITPTKVGQFVVFWEKNEIIKTNLTYMRKPRIY